MEEKQNVFSIIQRITTQSFAIKGFSFTVIVLIANIFDKFLNWSLLAVSIFIVLDWQHFFEQFLNRHLFSILNW